LEKEPYAMAEVTNIVGLRGLNEHLFCGVLRYNIISLNLKTN
jgi:hypothetical protein